VFQVPYWSKLEDAFLDYFSDKPDNKYYQMLVEVKGPEEIKRRKDYLY